MYYKSRFTLANFLGFKYNRDCLLVSFGRNGRRKERVQFGSLPFYCNFLFRFNLQVDNSIFKNFDGLPTAVYRRTPTKSIIQKKKN